MKSWGKTLSLGLAAAIVICLAARAQLNSLTLTSPPPPPDSIVSAVADEKGLPLVPPGEVPRFGTFWTFFPGAGSGITPPFPCLCDSNLPVYEIAEGQFLVDGSSRVQAEWNTTQASRLTVRSSVADTVTAQANALMNLVDWLQGIEQDRQLRLLARAAGMDVPLPGDEGFGGGTNGYGASYAAQVFTTNDLWLQITGTSNGNSGTTITSYLTIHTPWNVTNGVYDLFATTNLAPSAWRWVMRCDPGQTNLIVTNLTTPQEFFILGLTNDTDGGGLTDAYEKLVTKTDPNNASDDRLTPLVGIQTTDAVAVEQNSANTATFVVSRLGGYMGQPLTVTLGISGTATAGTDYTLAPGSVVGTNFSVTIPTGQTSVTVTLAAVNDSLIEGTETATLTLLNNSGWTNDLAHSSSTAWILEDYTVTYTLNADFKLGVLSGLEAVNDQLQFKTNLPAQFPFINVACSARGTVARINTTNGMVVGEYRTTPLGLTYNRDSGTGPQPSRTTVDEYGNVWVANRADQMTINGTDYGSIARIGLIIGTRFQKNLNGTYTTNSHGQYVRISDASYNTCIDRDGDGFIHTSSGLADILAWSNGGGVDSAGGVSTADDEAITEYTRVPCTGTRTIAVDKFNDIWVGGHADAARRHVKVNGLLALPITNSLFTPSIGGYGGVIDGAGNLWSSDSSGNFLWFRPSTNFPPLEDIDWQMLTPSGYGIAVDPLYPRIWMNGGNIWCWNTNGTPAFTNTDGSIRTFDSGGGAKGLAVDANGHIWTAHDSALVGHNNTNGTWLGNVSLHIDGLYAEYFDNTNLAGIPVFTDMEGPVSYTNNWPESAPTNAAFSARWRGIVAPQVAGDHVFYVSAESNAIFRLIVNGTKIIDHWTNPVPYAVEWSGTNWLGTNIAYDIRLEYVHVTNDAQIRLSWLEPGMTNEEVIPLPPFQNYSDDSTGISVDPAGKIWVGCLGSSTAARIDPDAGPLVVTNEVIAGVTNSITNHVGMVDMVVNLGRGPTDPSDPHQSPYDVAASPYNYSDMTGFNEHVVNPGLQPFKGYWMVTDDSGKAGQLWNKVSWSNSLPTGCLIEVYVRAADARPDLASATFLLVTNGVNFPAIRGRYIEVRLGMMRYDPSKQPVVYDLTLHGQSSGFSGDSFLDDATAYERQDATFQVNLTGAAPMTYQWLRQYPWETNWVRVAGATNSTFTITNVDSWVDWTAASCIVSNGAGESLWLGSAYLDVYSVFTTIPVSGSSGPASRYPITINVFGQPTNLNNVVVTVRDLYHSRSADLNFLLVSPSGKRIILMSNVGGTNGVSNATISFKQSESQPAQAAPILPGGQHFVTYGPSNYGQVTPQIPFGLPAGNYSSNLNDLVGDDPNGVWKLYIYDNAQPGGTGQFYGSWTLDFAFQ